MNTVVYRKLFPKSWSRYFIEDYVAPFLIGFTIVFLFFWLRSLILEENKDFVSPPLFKDSNGQVYFKREGLMSELDIYKFNMEKNKFSIQADASNNFKRTLVRIKNYVQRKGKNQEDPPGAIWPWPRIEDTTNSLPHVWVVTPTYRNPFQYAELTRMAQAMYPSRKFVRWLIVDDSTKSAEHKNHLKDMKQFLLQFSIKFTIIKSSPKPNQQKVVFNPKGVDARRTALQYIRKRKIKGTIYFADDDNTYDSDIFRQIQGTKTVSIWPTGAITQWAVSSPVVNISGVVVDFFDAWTANRQFPVDFASIAVNSDFIHGNPRVNIPWIQGYEETIFLRSLGILASEFQPLAANATEVLTWHTRTAKSLTFLQNKIDVVLKELSDWPKTARDLIKKYEFMFNITTWIEKPNPRGKKSKGDTKDYYGFNETTTKKAVNTVIIDDFM